MFYTTLYVCTAGRWPTGNGKKLPGTAGPGNMLGCCLIYFHFLWAIHPIRPVLVFRGQWAMGMNNGDPLRVAHGNVGLHHPNEWYQIVLME